MPRSPSPSSSLISNSPISSLWVRTKDRSEIEVSGSRLLRSRSSERDEDLADLMSSNGVRIPGYNPWRVSQLRQFDVQLMVMVLMVLIPTLVCLVRGDFMKYWRTIFLKVFRQIRCLHSMAATHVYGLVGNEANTARNQVLNRGGLFRRETRPNPRVSRDLRRNLTPGTIALSRPTVPSISLNLS
ncbi:hypothetical protein RRG08_038820 [Elysia crispata]|uniref:Uncharacterized protein n=1 Tax=Elysia crispata TaxID=231223 RepID=A0AAE1D4L6_9GAST|nr:hypothetical protein RRG08_038820 [Elysia crispata]